MAPIQVADKERSPRGYPRRACPGAARCAKVTHDPVVVARSTAVNTARRLPALIKLTVAAAHNPNLK